jgi:hypothetical protein
MGGDSYGNSLGYRELLRWVPPTTSLLHRRTTKRLNFRQCPAARSFGQQEPMTNGNKKQGAESNLSSLNLNAEALRPKRGKREFPATGLGPKSPAPRSLLAAQPGSIVRSSAGANKARGCKFWMRVGGIFPVSWLVVSPSL